MELKSFYKTKTWCANTHHLCTHRVWFPNIKHILQRQWSSCLRQPETPHRHFEDGVEVHRLHREWRGSHWVHHRQAPLPEQQRGHGGCLCECWLQLGTLQQPHHPCLLFPVWVGWLVSWALTRVETAVFSEDVGPLECLKSWPVQMGV